VGIPAYSRCSELVQLLDSIYLQSVPPAEIAICEDKSPERDSIRAIVDSWRERFAAKSCQINYHENESNLGYDGNVRKVIEVSRSPWVMLMGNDDLLLPECIETAQRFITANPDVPMISRSFVMFQGDLKSSLGVSRHSPTDQVYKHSNASPAMIFRVCGFVGGLIVNREWASGLATDRYDGSLYYQIYLGAEAFCQEGIGYINRSIVGSRAGNPPLFGSAASEKAVHVPGFYSPKARAKMWASVLRISDEVGVRHRIDLLSHIKKNLEVRESFHIFEMMAGTGRHNLAELRSEFSKLGLFGHPVPRALYLLDVMLGSRAKWFFRAVRRFRGLAFQRRSQ